MNQTAKHPVCLECGTPIKGRSDKKFCNDGCRNAHYNKMHRVQTNYMRKVNRILSKNRGILERLNPSETTKVSKKRLLSEGFVFDYYTNVYVTKNGKEYRFCYDQGYLDVGGDWFALVVKKEYV
jgi:predicted nucleic acid-binding Zn ribbon protein